MRKETAYMKSEACKFRAKKNERKPMIDPMKLVKEAAQGSHKLIYQIF